MLRAGVVAGPLYVIVSLIEVLTRPGFDPRRHAWSQLANGDRGWIHSATLIVCGLLIVLAAYRWEKFLAVYGLGMVVAGIFKADPGRGFPAGTPEVVPLSTSGLIHFAAGGIGFIALIIACRRQGSRTVGVLFGLGYVALIAGGGAAWSLLTFTAAVIMVSVWISVKSLQQMKNEKTVTMEVVR